MTFEREAELREKCAREFFNVVPHHRISDDEVRRDRRMRSMRAMVARLLMIPCVFIVLPTAVLFGLIDPRYMADTLTELGTGLKAWLDLRDR